jgi:hypothetical protein
MNELPDFAEAVEVFRRFLADSGHPDRVIWVFRDDLWKRSLTQVLIKYPLGRENAFLAQKVFADGRACGLVEIKALAASSDKVAATVWFPKYPEEEVQGWDQGMKLSIIQPLAQARLVGAWRWRLIQFLPLFKQ